MKTKKRFLSILLSLVLMLVLMTALTVTALAEDTYTIYLSRGNITTVVEKYRLGNTFQTVELFRDIFWKEVQPQAEVDGIVVSNGIFTYYPEIHNASFPECHSALEIFASVKGVGKGFQKLNI